MPEAYEAEYYTPDQITPDFLAGAVDETQPRLMRVLDFAERVENETETIEIDVIIEQYDEAADLAGFSDSSKLVKGREATKRLVQPFHVKNSYPFMVTDRGRYVQRQGSSYTISGEGVAAAIEYLEQRRRNLLRIALLAMMNDRQFVYAKDKLKITVPYTQDIGKLTTPGTKLGDGGFDLTKFIYDLKQEFYTAAGQLPTTVFMNSNSGGKLLQNSSLKAAFLASQSSDPENSGQLWESFNYGGINWNILHEKYPRLDGTLADPIDNGRLVATVDQVQAVGPEAGAPFKILSAENVLNNFDAGSPYYDTYSLGEDPWGMAVRLYDNMIPAVMKRNIVMQMDDFHA